MSNRSITTQLTAQERLFVEAFVECGDAFQTVLAVGFDKCRAGNIARALLNRPDVALEIARESRKRLIKHAPMAIGVLVDLAKNSPSPKVKLDAAKSILDRAGLIAPKAQEDRTAVEIPLHEMTMDQLRALATQLESEFAGRAKPVNDPPLAPAQAPGEPPKKPKWQRAAKPSVAEQALKDIEG